MPQGRKHSSIAIVLVDVINAFDFSGSAPLVRAASKAALRMPRGQPF